MTFTADENGVYQDSLVYNAETGTPSCSTTPRTARKFTP